ncbi:LysR family transcriptional regulator [Sphingomonas oligoaromativorans]|uniref:LysR family transcriptional regulator n=1 Tax=Sphingomonas oligoaromativorans TaxID=575322 RepID=UPI001422583B|nr:LysR substrate-binding domain-containing protein [Sphingomonas oligoaromativorans]NIJ35070.1 DNA-binding transcriptional LysR family regulator [Sphingomonas oligoaromativorans]
MELRHLRYFAVLAEELHFARAAERLNIAPPTLTVQIQEIERRLGTPLLVRTRRSVALTQAGAIFLHEARQVIARFERAETIGRRAAQGQIGRLDIGYVGSAAYSGVLQEQVRQFRRTHPDVDVHTRELVMEELPERVRTGEVDVGFVRLPMALPEGLVSRTVLHDHFCLALPPDHRLARQAENPSPRQLAGEPLVVPEQLAGTDEIARRGGFTPIIVARPGRMSAVLIEVSLGTGVSIVPSSVRDVLRLPHLCFRDIAGKPVPSEVAAIFRAEGTVIAGMFVGQLGEG